MSVTLQEINELCAEIIAEKERKKEAETVASNHESRIKELETKLMLLFEENELTSYVSPSGRFTIAQKESVTTPKDAESKEKFFEYLKEKGIYWDFVTVNSQKLNGFYREEREEFMKRLEAGEVDGFDFNIPGIGEPSIFKYFHFTKNK